MAKQITSTFDVIETLGGTSGMCALLGVKSGAVSVWRVYNSFPAHHFPKIQAALTRLGKAADISLFHFERKPYGSTRSPSRRSLSRKR